MYGRDQTRTLAGNVDLSTLVCRFTSGSFLTPLPFSSPPPQKNNRGQIYGRLSAVTRAYFLLYLPDCLMVAMHSIRSVYSIVTRQLTHGPRKHTDVYVDCI